ncbi:MAG: glycosyltransferase [Verrucomicrobia bacterium]|nr:glycosyltransferase [Verrucomicrobiota bacterium]
MDPNRLIIFAKAPRPGFVKTRLAAALGDLEAAKAYQTLVEVLLDNLKDLREVELRFSPDDALPEIQRWIRESWRARPQGAGDLGQRLTAAFADAFASGAERVVIIGSDCPAVTMEDIGQSWTALLTHDVVLGPATDGGYWLVGLREPHTTLFYGIAWSTAAVLQQTLERTKAAGLDVHFLRELADVDTEADWSAFVQRQHSNPS